MMECNNNNNNNKNNNNLFRVQLQLYGVCKCHEDYYSSLTPLTSMFQECVLALRSQRMITRSCTYMFSYCDSLSHELNWANTMIL
jgi:hypothetical protein